MRKIAVTTAVILLLCLCFSGCAGTADDSPSDLHTEIESVSDISYVADFQGVKVLSSCNADGVAAVVIHNTADRTLQYIKFSATFSDGTVYTYSASTVPPGAGCTVYEDSSSPYKNLESGILWRSENVAFFTDEPSANSDMLEYTGSDGIITVKNISDTDITDNIVIYYKDYDGTQFSSGVTYRVTVSGGIKSGEVAQVQAQHYSPDISLIMFSQFVGAEVS